MQPLGKRSDKGRAKPSGNVEDPAPQGRLELLYTIRKVITVVNSVVCGEWFDSDVFGHGRTKSYANYVGTGCTLPRRYLAMGTAPVIGTRIAPMVMISI